MGYKESKNQIGVNKSKIRYDFDLFFNGKRHRKRITCMKSTVATFYRQWEKEIMDGFIGKYKLFEKLDEYLNNHVKHVKTKQRYKFEKNIINKTFKVYFHDEIYLHEFKRTDAEEFMKWRRTYVASNNDNTLAKGIVSNVTINRNIEVLSSFFTWAISKEYYFKVNPCHRIKLKESSTREVQLSKDQLKEFLDKARDQDIRLYNFISVALLSGMRKGELLSLEWKEVDFDNNRIVLSQYKTKSKKSRVIPLTNALKNILLTIKNKTYKNCNDNIFEDLTIHILRRSWNNLLSKLNFANMENNSRLHIHDLRHIYAQTLLNEGVQMEDIQFLLGHADISTTQRRYAMFARQDLEDKVKVIDNVFPLAQSV